MIRRLAFFLLASLLFAGCRADTPPPLLLVSIDGFRWDYLDTYDAPHLRALAETGVWASEGMTPVFPTVTFPNHYTIVTGLYPERHGIVGNTMYDPAWDAWFRIGDPEAVTDARWWGGEPLWVTAERQDMKSATYFWVGSEAPIGGVRPTYWFPYDAAVPGEDRVDQILAWLDLPPDDRPGFLTLYFSEVESRGHDHGHDAPETAAAVGRVDGYIGRLLDGLQDRGLRDAVNLILVADHGMVATAPDRLIDLDALADLDDVLVVDQGAFVALRPPDERVDEVYDALDGAHPHLRVYRRDELPAHLRYGDHDRITPLIGIPDAGWLAYTRNRLARMDDFTGGGAHGYDTRVPDMRALFIAHGPAFRTGLTVDPFENVHLYPLMTHLLGLDPAPNDGSLDAVRAFLAP